MGQWMFQGMARTYRQRLPSVQRYLAFLVLLSAISGVCFVIYVLVENSLSPHDTAVLVKVQNPSLLQKIKQAAKSAQDVDVTKTYIASRRPKLLQKQLVKTNTSGKTESVTGGLISQDKMEHEDHKAEVLFKENTTVNFKVHMFYYPWYGNPQTDGEYLHWNHKMIPHWNKEKAARWPQDTHVPPDDLGANFYPALGPYSSAKPETVRIHMAQIRSTGTGVVVISWYPPEEADDNGKPLDSLVPLILDAAHSYGLKVCLHIEPYKDRNAATLHHHVRYIIDKYGHHPGFYRTKRGERRLPVFYVYDSYQVESSDWAQTLKPNGPLSLRGTEYDGIFLGLYLSPEDERKLLEAGFDGFYTYFAADGFTKGSTRINWKSMAKFAAEKGLLFVPSIGPGYVDTRVRPWNGENTRKRLQGKYFKQSFQAAVDAGAEYISVTSFNEWHEGTQIEPAIPKQIKGFVYEDYKPGGPDFYLQLLKSFVQNFSQQG